MPEQKYNQPQMDVTGTVNLSDPESVCQEIRKIYERNYRTDLYRNFDRIRDTILFVNSLFRGEVGGYQACDTAYHDFPHSSGTALAKARIFDGMNKCPSELNPPKITRRMFELGVNTGILHDTGFIKKEDDYKGTGAKYTLTHVTRSADFVEKHKDLLGFDEAQTRLAKNIISCTGVGLDIRKISFDLKEERTVGLVLCTADYLSQMSDPNYLDKLPILYKEFVEGNVAGFESVEDLIRKTPNFWRKVVLPKLENECDAVYRFLEYHFGEGRNLYIEKIEENITFIEEVTKQWTNTHK